VARARPPAGKFKWKELCYDLLVEREFDWVSKVYDNHLLGLAEYRNYQVYAALSALGCPYLALLLTDFEPSDPLGEVVDSWKGWVVRYEEVRRGGAAERRESVRGFLVRTYHLYRMSDDEREELEKRELEGGGYAAEHAAAMLAVQRELELLFDQVEAGVPGALEVFDRYMGVLSLLGERICVGLLEWKYPEEKLREWEEMGIVERTEGGFDVYFSDPERVPEELKRYYFKNWIRPLLRGLAEVLAPAYFGRVRGYICVVYFC